jgi:hypothetical protein
MTQISKLAELRKLMLEMEHSLGLQDLTSVERDLYYAVADLAEPASGARTNTILDHSLMSQVSRPTFFRALKSLVGKGYIEQCGTATRGRYCLSRAK